MQNSKNIAAIFILLEILVGLIGGILYVIKPEGSPKHSLMDSILNVYLILNGIFFGTIIVIGTVSAFFFRKTDRLFVSIMLSLAVGMGFLIIHAFVLSMAPFAFLSLFGFVLDFNSHLLKKPSSIESI